MQDEKGQKAATSWSNLKFIAVDINQIENIVDDQTVATSIKFSGTDADHHDKEVNIVTVDVKKLLPTGPKNFSWKSGAPITGNTLTLFMTPSATLGGAEDWTAEAAYGWVDMSTYCNNLNANYRFRFADANVLNDGAYENAVDVPTTPATSGKSVYVMNTATGEANDGNGFLFGLQGPADAGLIAAGADTYVNGTKTSGLKVQYTYATAISRKYTTSMQAPTRPTVDIPTNVTTAKFTYALATSTYRPVRYDVVKTWTAASATPTVYYGGTWTTASSDYVLYYDGTVLGGNAFQPAIVAPLFPTDNDGTDNDAWRWNATDAAIAAPGNIWTQQLAYENAADKVAITGAAGCAVLASTGYASRIVLDNFLISENSEVPAYNNIPFDYTTMMLNPVVSFKSDLTGVEEYYNATWNPTSKCVRFAPTGAANPVRKVASTLKIEANDAFGQDVIITVPITVAPY